MRLAVAVVVLTVVLTAGCREVPLPLEAEIDRAMERGAAFLLARQDDDGAWRSGVYGAFKNGDALTPLASRALGALPATPEIGRALMAGTDYLAELAPGGDGSTPPLFAVYTAAQAAEVLSWSADPRHRAARDAWVAELEGRQLDEDLGWSEDDPFFGGWGYSTAVPRKPPPGSLQPPLLESNMSATVFALRGLEAAGALAGGDVCGRALVFLDRLQNFSEPPSSFDDGGFFFIPGDPVRNKAGVAGVDERGGTRYHSYGSATADGLRGLLACGRPAGHPRVASALAWLAESFSSAEHPGRFEPRLEADRDGLFYYWAASLTEAYDLAGIGPGPWAEDLARELVRRQGEDGSWVNGIVTMREDEPVVATSMALLALSALRESVNEAP